MFGEVEDCKRVMSEEFNKPLVLTPAEEEDFQSTVVLYIEVVI